MCITRQQHARGVYERNNAVTLDRKNPSKTMVDDFTYYNFLFHVFFFQSRVSDREFNVSARCACDAVVSVL